jgi:hypothetical protein
LFSTQSLKKRCVARPNNYKEIKFSKIAGEVGYRGLSFEGFKKIQKEIKKTEINFKNKNILINLSSDLRIKPEEIYVWFKRGNIKKDIYTTKIKPIFVNLFKENFYK